jgi:hypothetical protein
MITQHIPPVIAAAGDNGKDIRLVAEGAGHPAFTRACSHYRRGAGFASVFRQARRISAEILCVLQGNATQHGGKQAKIRSLRGSVNTL